MAEQGPDNLTWKQLYRLSKYVYQETFLEATLQQMGANQSRFMERITRDKNILKRQSTILPIVMFFYTLILMSFPITAFLNIQSEIGSGLASHWIFFAGSFAIGLFFLISLGYILLFGLLQSSELVSGDAFKFLSTLPIAEKDLQRTVMLTFFRSVQVQVIMSLVVFPIGVAIATANPLVVLLGICVSTVSLLFVFSVLILVGGRVNRVLRGNDVNTTKASIIRVATLLGIGLGSFFFIFVFQFAIGGMNAFFLPPPLTAGGIDLLNLVMSLIPFPFAGNYLLVEVFIGGQSVPPELWLTSTIGFILFILITGSIFRKAVKTLRHVIYFEPKRFSVGAPSTVKPVKVEVVSPVRAFIKKDLSFATRDYQTLMYLIMPLILPIMSVFAVTSASTSRPDFDYLILFGINAFYLLLGAVMITYGLTSVESSGASVLASLPVVVRDQALGKIFIMLVVTLIASLIPCVFVFNKIPFDQVVALLVVSLPLGPIFGLIGLEMRALLFGKLKHQYILEEFNRDFKILKWIAIGIVECSVIGVISVVLLTMTLLGANLASLVIPCLLGEGGTIAILAIIFNKMFPKEGKGNA